MKPGALDAAISVAGTAGLAGILLPSIDEAWDAPRGDGKTRERLSTGEQVFFLILLTVGALQSLKTRSFFPLVFAAGLGGAVAWTYERALEAPGGG